MDTVTRACLFFTGALMLTFGVCISGGMIASAFDRYFPSPCPVLQAATGVLILILFIGVGASMIYQAR